PNAETSYGYGTEAQADAYCAHLNARRVTNCYHASPVTDPALSTRLDEDGSEGGSLGFDLEDALGDRETTVGQLYTAVDLGACDWAGWYPLVRVLPDGTVHIIDAVLGDVDLSSDEYVLIDVRDGRVSRAGTGHESDAAA